MVGLIRGHHPGVNELALSSLQRRWGEFHSGTETFVNRCLAVVAGAPDRRTAAARARDPP
jgi:hypothetical protein